MKTLTEKTDELLESIMHCDFRTEVGVDKAKRIIRRAIKDRDSESKYKIALADAIRRPMGVVPDSARGLLLLTSTNNGQSIMFKVIGMSDNQICDCCGRKGLKRTVAVEIESGEIQQRAAA